MSEMVKKFKYLIEKSKYFQSLKDDENFLFSEIIKIPSNDIIQVKNSYTNEGKIKKIRYEVADLLLEDQFNQQNFEELKNKINNQYDTNILQSWKNFSILYVFFFNPIKDIVNQYLNDIGNYFVESSGENLKLKTTNFDGTQNFGDVGCWIALYNPKYKSQSEGVQYFINFYHNSTTYGTYKHEDKRDIDRKTYNIDILDEKLIQNIVDDIKLQRDLILENGVQHKDQNEDKDMPNKNNQPLNQILYGPPGTGKTYKTINRALEIILEQQPNDEIKGLLVQDTHTDEERKKLKDEFEEYKKNGQIEFVTFHQSYGYEEFVEGIKAETTETENIKYEVQPGIFKHLSEKASTKSSSNIDEKIDWLKSKLIDDNFIDIEYGKSKFSISYRGGKTFRVKPHNSKNEEADYPASIENIVKLYKGSKKNEIYNATYTNGILEYLYKNGLIKYEEIQDTNVKNYILIIDEINRGNISKIFGELITLIEPSKRIEADEALQVKLPYSGEVFGVPSNLYIIGTMNTADRSIALMDTALRRRFEFEEMMPDLETLNDLPEIEGINIKSLLETINKRIEYLYDRDHTIGHAYFMSLKGKGPESAKVELDNIFKNKIIPLLQEYFYDDWEKIQMVLGDHPEQKENDENKFIKSIDLKEISLFGFDHEEIEDEQVTYMINETFTVPAYSKIKVS